MQTYSNLVFIFKAEWQREVNIHLQTSRTMYAYKQKPTVCKDKTQSECHYHLNSISERYKVIQWMLASANT